MPVLTDCLRTCVEKKAIAPILAMELTGRTGNVHVHVDCRRCTPGNSAPSSCGWEGEAGERSFAKAARRGSPEVRAARARSHIATELKGDADD